MAEFVSPTNRGEKKDRKKNDVSYGTVLVLLYGGFTMLFI